MNENAKIDSNFILKLQDSLAVLCILLVYDYPSESIGRLDQSDTRDSQKTALELCINE